MRARPLLRCRVLLTALAGAAAVPAGADGSAARSLEPIVVTGTRTERPSADSPVRVEVVDPSRETPPLAACGPVRQGAHTGPSSRVKENARFPGHGAGGEPVIN